MSETRTAQLIGQRDCTDIDTDGGFMALQIDNLTLKSSTDLINPALVSESESVCRLIMESYHEVSLQTT